MYLSKTRVPPSSSRVSTIVWLHRLDSNKRTKKKLDENDSRMQCGSSTPQTVWSLTSYLTNHPSFAEEVRKNSLATLSYRLLFIDITVLAV